MSGTTKILATKTKKPSNGKPATSKELVVTHPQALVDERINKLEQLNGITSRRGRTLGTLNKLKTFKFSGDDSSIMEIKDAAGNKFATSNNNLIALVVEHLEGLLQGKLGELDSEVLAFKL